jgi:Fe-Mn family superoxide dismutase
MPNLNRRSLLVGAATLSTCVISTRSWGQTTDGPFKLPPLDYALNSLEPHIDAKTMEIHHGRHHAAYVNTLNATVKDHGELAKQSLEQILANLNSVPDSIRTRIRNNAGGHANHTMFWQIMGKETGKPEGELLAAIDRDLGGLDKMQQAFNTAGTGVFGSGWVFVTADKSGKLTMVSRPNQDTPLMEGQRVLFGNDVWEHAYYLNYQNRRLDYLKAWWNVINWNAVGRRYTDAKAGKLDI